MCFRAEGESCLLVTSVPRGLFSLNREQLAAILALSKFKNMLIAPLKLVTFMNLTLNLLFVYL